MERYDIAIIGTGPAGLEAAITAKVRNKNIILIGQKTLSDKVVKAHAIQNYLGLPDISGEAMQKAFTDHIAEYGIEITPDKITSIYSMGDYFALQASSNVMYEASALILACGINQAKALPGEIELLGRGVSYCATCDASLYKGKDVAVVAYSKKEEEEADFLSEIASNVYYFPMYKEEVTVDNKIHIINEKVTEVQQENSKRVLHTDKNNYNVDGVFILREAVAPAQLVPGLVTDGKHVVVDLQMKTSIDGCFACGDIAGEPYQYIKAAGQGNIAALSAVKYLSEMKKKNN